MKLDRLFLFKVLNIIIIIVSVVISVIAGLEAEKSVDKDVFYISPVINDDRYYFDINDLDEFKEVYNPVEIAYTSLCKGLINYKNYTVYSKIIYTNSSYFSMNNIQFVGGGAWPSYSKNKNIIINKSLAWQLFGSVDVVGKEVSVSNESRTIIGIMDQKDISKDDCFAYLPVNTLDNPRMSNVFVKVSNYNKLTPHDNISNWLEKTGRNQRDYYITDMNRYVESIGIKYKILILIIGIYTSAVIVINSWKLVKNNRLNFKNIVAFSVLFASDLFIVVVLVKSISIDIWVPHSEGGRLNELIRVITNSDFLPSQEYLSESLNAISKLNTCANTALVFCTVALTNFIFVHKGIRTKH